MKTIKWNMNKDISLIDQYIMILCSFSIKRDLKYRKNMTGDNSFQSYMNLYKNLPKDESILLKDDVYKTILDKIENNDLTNEERIKIYKDINKYYNFPTENKTTIAKCILSFSFPLMLISILLAILFHNIYLGIIPTFLGFISLQCFLINIDSKTPEKYISRFLNCYLPDYKCFNTLKMIGNSLQAEPKKEKESVSSNETNTCNITNITNETNITNISNTIIETNIANETNITNNTNKENKQNESSTQNKASKSIKSISNKKKYSDMTIDELKEAFFKKYNKVPKNFFDILRTKEYQNQILLKEDYSFVDKKYFPIVATYLSDKHVGRKHDNMLLSALFKYEKDNISNFNKRPYKRKLAEFTQFINENL